MIILGIDPGSRRIGYGLIEKNGQKLTYLEAGLLKITGQNDQSALLETKNELGKLLKKFKPDVCAVEKLYFVRNQTTGIAVGQTRGVILVTLAEYAIPTKEFSPNEIKSRVAGYGLANKKSIAKMVALILQKKELRLIDDAWDALAIGLACSFETRKVLYTP